MSVFANKGVRLIGGGWCLFIAENLILSENKPSLVRNLGEGGYRALYGTLSTLACGSIAVGYIRFGRGQGPILWRPTGAAPQTAAFVLQAVGLVGFSQLVPPLQMPFTTEEKVKVADEAEAHNHPSIGKRASQSTKSAASTMGLKAQCPINFDHSRKLEGREVCGAQRVTRHPALWSMAMVGLGSACGSPLATEVLFGVFPSVMAAVGGAHIDHRHRKSGELTPAKDAATSLFPFAALARGSGEDWAALAEEVSWSNAAIAVGVAAGLTVRRRTALKAFFK